MSAPGRRYGRVDARPVELREPRHLVRVGVGQRQRVAAAAVEGAAQVQHLGAERRIEPAGLVEPALPVERHLERVLDGERATVDEEQVRQRRIAEHPRERVDEAGHRHAVDVGVARLVDGRRGEFGAELGVVGQRRMVHAQRRRGEEREHVEVALAGAGIDEVRAGRALDVEHEVESVGQDAAAQHLVHVVGGDISAGGQFARWQDSGHAAILTYFLRSLSTSRQDYLRYEVASIVKSL